MIKIQWRTSISAKHSQIPRIKFLAWIQTSVSTNFGEEAKEVYSDIKLDLAFSEYKNPSLNAKFSTNDLQDIVNEEAIITSLRNIFNTALYTRLLNPDATFDIRSFLFEPLTEAKAYFMAYKILHTLPSLEPRISIDNISVSIDAANSAYHLGLSISIPSLSTSVSLSGILNSDGYSLYD